ncbi:MAG: ArsR/SmtB family transcription factor [Thermosulfidibacteraceae bacterium]
MIKQIDDATLEKWANFFKALAHPVRLRIILTLIEKGEACVKSMCEILETSQSNISQHISILKNANIIKCQKRVMLHCYRINDERIAEILKIIKEG